ncbi:response regulator [Roseivirga sp.]|uniref:response regulator n=1 Tax=Roseivirga sp. TaxID=1964215 RepID=UPI002B272FD8|nr:response regulator [Roseivirga sp.]
MNKLARLQPRHPILSRKILIVDDNDINRQYLRSVLSDEDTELLSASNGQMALKFLENHIPDVILMDIQMPEMDGFECLNLIKKKHSDYPSLVFAVTGFSDDFGNTSFKQLGFDELFLKPIKANLFKDQIENLLQKWRKEKASSNHLLRYSDAELVEIKTIKELRKYASQHELLEIYKDFESETSEALKQLKSHFESNDIDKILSILHTIKGNSASLGISPIAKFSEQVEFEIKNSQTIDSENYLPKLLALFAKFVSNYERILKLN